MCLVIMGFLYSQPRPYMTAYRSVVYIIVHDTVFERSPLDSSINKINHATYYCVIKTRVINLVSHIIDISLVLVSLWRITNVAYDKEKTV